MFISSLLPQARKPLFLAAFLCPADADKPHGVNVEGTPVTTHQLHFHINLGALLSQLHNTIQRTIYLAALGLNAPPRLTQEDLQLPGTSISLSFGGLAWPIEEAREGFTQWILGNSLRDAAEAISGFLEETRTVLAMWQLGIRNRSEVITGADWHEATVSQRRRFHRLGLPDKIKNLQETYSLVLDSDLVRHLLSINAARNCLVHRRGIVQEQDINEDGAMRVSWRRLALVIRSADGEREGFVGVIVNVGESVCVSNRDESKPFPLGTAISFSVQEFADVCWSLVLFGTSTTKLIEDWASERGIELQMPQAATG
jgi:hypothetical protein